MHASARLGCDVRKAASAPTRPTQRTPQVADPSARATEVA